MESDCIPAGMELFPAADEEQFEFMKRVIDDCDYYLVIIGGRYGSLTAEGISFTEKEYDYAISRKIKVMAFLHEHPDEIPFGKSEQDPALREKLQQFRTKVASGRLVKFWKTLDALPGLVSQSLQKTIKLFPAVGWVRADKIASEDLLNEINQLRKSNDELQKRVASLGGKLPVSVDNLAGLDEQFTVRVEYWRGSLHEAGTTCVTWKQVFSYISPYLLAMPADTTVKAVLDDAFFRQLFVKDGGSPSLDDQQFRTIAIQLMALGLVRTEYQQSTSGDPALFWSLTPKGEQLMFQLRTVKRTGTEE
jgi:hypothetical protein